MTQNLTDAGYALAKLFCETNDLPLPELRLTTIDEWAFDWVPAFYRPQHIALCVQKCSGVAGEAVSRNWNWPGATTDKTPYGVIAHELGHHVDWTLSDTKYRYFGNFGHDLMVASGEKSVSGYEADKPHEAFAECFRVYLTNAPLLKELRPKIYELLAARLKPVVADDWTQNLIGNPPSRIVSNLQKNIGATC